MNDDDIPKTREEAKVKLFELRRNGMQFRKIAPLVGYSYEWCRSNWMEMLAETVTTQDRESVRSEEDARLLAALEVAMKIMSDPLLAPDTRLKAVREVRMISRARASLMGADREKIIRIEGVSTNPMGDVAAKFIQDLGEVESAADLLVLIDQ